ncbi:hypothetical protein DFJ74DRAFT_660551 [Hyaloraphidium curvatum]|nr:hypothetical protein DFJ74DRAFT_660551 [Hyaloraphidium curvatum]
MLVLSRLVRDRLQAAHAMFGATDVQLVVAEADGHFVRDAELRLDAHGQQELRLVVTSDRDPLYMAVREGAIHGIADLFTDVKGATPSLFLKQDILAHLDVTAEELKASVLVAGSHNTTSHFIGAKRFRDVLRANKAIIDAAWLQAREAVPGSSWIRTCLDMVVQNNLVTPKPRDLIAADKEELVRIYHETEGKRADGTPQRRLRLPLDVAPSAQAMFPLLVPLAEVFAMEPLAADHRKALEARRNELRNDLRKFDERYEPGEKLIKADAKTRENMQKELIDVLERLGEQPVPGSIAGTPSPRPRRRHQYVSLKVGKAALAQPLPADAAPGPSSPAPVDPQQPADPSAGASASASAGPTSGSSSGPASSQAMTPERDAAVKVAIKMGEGIQAAFERRAKNEEERREVVGKHAWNAAKEEPDGDGYIFLVGGTAIRSTATPGAARDAVRAAVAAEAASGSAGGNLGGNAAAAADAGAPRGTAAGAAAPVPMEVDPPATSPSPEPPRDAAMEDAFAAGAGTAVGDVPMDESAAGPDPDDDDDEAPEDDETRRRTRQAKGKGRAEPMNDPLPTTADPRTATTEALGAGEPEGDREGAPEQGRGAERPRLLVRLRKVDAEGLRWEHVRGDHAPASGNLRGAGRQDSAPAPAPKKQKRGRGKADEGFKLDPKDAKADEAEEEEAQGARKGGGAVTIPGPVLDHLVQPWSGPVKDFIWAQVRQGKGRPSDADIEDFMRKQLGLIGTEKQAEVELAERRKFGDFMALAFRTQQRLLMAGNAAFRIVLDTYLHLDEEQRAAWFPGVPPSLNCSDPEALIDNTYAAVATALRLEGGGDPARLGSGIPEIRAFLRELGKELTWIGLQPDEDPVRIRSGFEEWLKQKKAAAKVAYAKDLAKSGKPPRARNPHLERAAEMEVGTLCRIFPDLAREYLDQPISPDREDGRKRLFLQRNILRLAPLKSWSPRGADGQDRADEILGLPAELAFATDEDAGPDRTEIPAPQPVDPDLRHEYRQAMRETSIAMGSDRLLIAMQEAAGRQLRGLAFVDFVETRFRVLAREPGLAFHRGGALDDPTRRFVYGDLSAPDFDPSLPVTLLFGNCPKLDVLLGSRRHFLNPTNKLLFNVLNVVALHRLQNALERAKRGDPGRYPAEVLEKDIKAIKADINMIKETEPLKDPDDAHWEAATAARCRVLGNIVFADVNRMCPMLFNDGDECCCCDLPLMLRVGRDKAPELTKDEARRAMALHRRMQLEFLRHELRAFHPALVVGLGVNMRKVLDAASGDRDVPTTPLPFSTGGVASLRLQPVTNDDLLPPTDFEVAMAPHPISGVKLPSHLADSITAINLIPDPSLVPGDAAVVGPSWRAVANIDEGARLAIERLLPRVYRNFPDTDASGTPLMVSLAAASLAISDSFIEHDTMHHSYKLFPGVFAQIHSSRLVSTLTRLARDGLRRLVYNKAHAYLSKAFAPGVPRGLINALAYRLRCVLVPPKRGGARAIAAEEEGDEEAEEIVFAGVRQAAGDDDADTAGAVTDETPAETVLDIYARATILVGEVEGDVAGLRERFTADLSAEKRGPIEAAFDLFLNLLTVADGGVRSAKHKDDVRTEVGLGTTELSKLTLVEQLVMVRRGVVAGELRQNVVPRLHAGDRFQPVDNTAFGRWISAYIGHLHRLKEGGTDKDGRPVPFALADVVRGWDVPRIKAVQDALDKQNQATKIDTGTAPGLPALMNKMIPGLARVVRGPAMDRGDAHVDRFEPYKSSHFQSNGIETRILVTNQRHPHRYNQLGGVRTKTAAGDPILGDNPRWPVDCRGCKKGKCDRLYPGCS